MWKKIFAAAVLMAVLTSCSRVLPVSAEEVAAAYSGGFSCAALAVYGDESAELVAEKNGMSISFAVDSPEELAGLSIVFDGENTTLGYKGMEMALSGEALPDNAPFSLFCSMAGALALPDELFLSTENGMIKVKGDGFSAWLSEDDLSLVRAEFPASGASFSFSEFHFLPDE